MCCSAFVRALASCCSETGGLARQAVCNSAMLALLLCRWWRQVVQHLAAAQEVAEAYQQKHACRAAFQVGPHLSLMRPCLTQSASCGAYLQHQGWQLLGRPCACCSA